jgi:TolB protein
VFVSGYNNADIYVLDIHNPLPKRLTDNPGGDTTPSWSPDGNRIAYVSGQGTDPASLYLMDAHCPAHCDQNVIPLTRHGYDFFPTWSPDGQHIAYISDQGGRRGIFVLDMACLQEQTSCVQEQPHLLALGHIIMNRLNWSADGEQVLFLANEDGFPELYAVEAHCEANTGCEPAAMTAIGRSFLGLRF